MSVEAWITAKLAAIGAWFKKEVKVVEPVVLADLQAAEKLLGPIAMQLVVGLIEAKLSDGTPMPGIQKRTSAVADLMTAALNKGKAIALSYANKIVEDSVYALSIDQNIPLVADTNTTVPNLLDAVQNSTLSPVPDDHVAALAATVAAQ